MTRTPALYPVAVNIAPFCPRTLVSTELPFVSMVYNQQEQLHQDVSDWLEYFTKNQENLPLYALDEAAGERASATLTRYYGMLMRALDRLFALDERDISHWFDCSGARQRGAFKTFLDYARADYQYRTQRARLHNEPLALYGRFDAVLNPATGVVEAVYEFNGDTPVMLFESINLQNAISVQLGAAQQQHNEWWEQNLQAFKSFANKAVAVVCDINFIEDASTSETVAQLFEHVGARVYFTTIESFNHDILSLDRPFRVQGVREPIDAVMMLLPWEEMMLSGQEILSHWQRWYRNVQFFEPPWRWFISHKGMLAYVTHLLDTDADFSGEFGDLPHLPCYLSPERFLREKQPYAQKPVVGRLSQNITLHLDVDSAPQPATPGSYETEPMVFQSYHAPHRLPGRNNFILGGWVSNATVSTLCFREFDGAVLDLKNERFVAHRLVATDG